MAARHAVGLQLDRDQLKAVLVDLSGTLVAERTAPLDFGGGAETVLSAVEGLTVDAHGFEHYVVPITVVILIGLFSVQRMGTAWIGQIFHDTPPWSSRS